MKVHNFSAGPAILPPSVIEQAAAGVLNFNGTGLSVLEMSHRSKEIVAVVDEASALVKELIGLTDDYEVVWLTGGASTQFFLTAMNLLDESKTAAFVDTGTWAAKAIEAARSFGNVEVLASSKSTTYDHIPKGWSVPDHAEYLHITSNNTIYGTQYHWTPATDKPIVCDMSSDFLSRPIDFAKYGLIYAGAQKNIGPAGTTCVIIRKDMLGKVERKIPVMFDYRTFIKEKSMYNTPPVFPIYVSLLTMRWIKEVGGLEGMAAHNEKKAAILYNEIDQNPLFKGNVAQEDRSLMNVCFVMHNRDLEPEFAAIAKENGIQGIAGHRSVGGFRASIYNAMATESIQLLADLMHDFAERKG
ncbi:MAG: 3-phosphoserine/phosphohydroxythreonine transaminase [Saprospiraceae bacterium]|nr:3-phosphoserine/phosphohydroxythreonine transaminase [Saprospiraceae bacterium]